MSKHDQLKQIHNEIAELKESPLYAERIANKAFPVIGEGNHDASIVFIGEAPGKNEAMTGKPFCGASGKVLDQLLEHAGITRSDVYITNIVKDRPTNNRDPKPEEIALYAPFLIRQLDIIQPKIIATLGRFSMDFVMRHFGLEDGISNISQIHGQVFEISTQWGKAYVIPLYHPAVAIYNRSQLDELKTDIKKMTALI